MRRVWLWFKYSIEYAGFMLASVIFRSLGVERASRVSGALWRAVAPRLKRHARALANLERALPDTTPAEREAIARDMWENMGRTFGEAFHLDEIASSDRVVFEHREVLDAWAARPGGKVACAAHLANWELAILGITRSGARPWSIYQRIKNPLVDRKVATMRGFLYTGGLVQKNPTLPRLFMKVLREGGTLGFLSDLREYGGIAVPFFGIPAPTTTFPALLARSVNAPILMVRMRRVGRAPRFVQSFELIETQATDDRKADVAATTAMIQAAIERYIREAPAQWMWAHRRWG